MNGTHSIMGGNWRHLRSKYGMEEFNVMKSWDEKWKEWVWQRGLSMEWKNVMLWKVEMKSGKNEYEFVRVCEQINRNM